MQKDNIVRTIPLTEIIEFSIQKEALAKKELNTIYSHGFFLKEYFIQDNHIYYTFKRRDKIENIVLTVEGKNDR